jgi:DNA-binding transcriptional ArsR family regulator
VEISSAGVGNSPEARGPGDVRTELKQGVGWLNREHLVECLAGEILDFLTYSPNLANQLRSVIVAFRCHPTGPFALDEYVHADYCGRMDDELSIRKQISTTANALGDDTRLRLLMLLLAAGTTGLTVTDLAERLELAQPRISTHLAILKDVGLVDGRSTGRTRVYRANTERALPLLDAVKRAAGVETAPPPSPAALKEINRNSPYRNARTCYDHLAGLAAVDLLDQFIFDRWLIRSGGPDERPLYDPTESGTRAFARLGVDLKAIQGGRRVLACGCLDWTERRPHLAGTLGASVLHALESEGFVEREPSARHVRIVRNLDDWLARA